MPYISFLNLADHQKVITCTPPLADYPHSFHKVWLQLDESVGAFEILTSECLPNALKVLGTTSQMVLCIVRCCTLYDCPIASHIELFKLLHFTIVSLTPILNFSNCHIFSNFIDCQEKEWPVFCHISQCLVPRSDDNCRRSRIFSKFPTPFGPVSTKNFKLP